MRQLNKNYLLICTMMLAVGAAKAQYGRKNKDVIPSLQQYKKTWYTAGGGITYSFPFLSEKEIVHHQNPDTLTLLNPSGRLGIHLFIGKYHITERIKGIRYIDYGLSFTTMRGREGITDKVDSAGTLVNTTTAEQTFSFGRAGVYLQAHFIKQLSDNTFLQNTIGADAQYAILNNNSSVPHLATSTGAEAPRFSTGAYYKIGYGIKLHKELLMIPGIQVPLLYWSPLRPLGDFEMFNSRYKPILFTLQFVPFKPKKEFCTPVKNDALPPGIYTPGQ